MAFLAIIKEICRRADGSFVVLVIFSIDFFLFFCVKKNSCFYVSKIGGSLHFILST